MHEQCCATKPRGNANCQEEPEAEITRGGAVHWPVLLAREYVQGRVKITDYLAENGAAQRDPPNHKTAFQKAGNLGSQDCLTAEWRREYADDGERCLLAVLIHR